MVPGSLPWRLTVDPWETHNPMPCQGQGHFQMQTYFYFPLIPVLRSAATLLFNILQTWIWQWSNSRGIYLFPRWFPIRHYAMEKVFPLLYFLGLIAQLPPKKSSESTLDNFIPRKRLRVSRAMKSAQLFPLKISILVCQFTLKFNICDTVIGWITSLQMFTCSCPEFLKYVTVPNKRKFTGVQNQHGIERPWAHLSWALQNHTTCRTTINEKN